MMVSSRHWTNPLTTLPWPSRRGDISVRLVGGLPNDADATDPAARGLLPCCPASEGCVTVATIDFLLGILRKAPRY